MPKDDQTIDEKTTLQEGATKSDDEQNVDTEQLNDQKNTQTTDDFAPEQYDFKSLELPDGIQLDAELTDEFSKAAKEMNLSQAKADKFMSMGIKLSQKIQNTFQSAIKEAQKQQIDTYSTMLNTDPEIGGSKLKQSLADANVAYEKFVSPEAMKLLSDSGLNKHPAIVKIFMNIGKQIKDDSVTLGGENKKERTAEDWYPEMKKNN